MKPIELTKEHKEKLLKMCKSLFFEYDKLEICSCEADVDETTTMVALFKTNNNFYINNAWSFPCMGNHIHWFEFCTKHLANKIYHSVNGWQDGNTTYSSFLAECVLLSKYHPVDYLYAQFKRNQHEKTPLYNYRTVIDNGVIPRKEVV